MKRRGFLGSLGAAALAPFVPAFGIAPAAKPSVTELIAAHHARNGTLRASAIGARYGLNPKAASALAARLSAAGYSLAGTTAARGGDRRPGETGA